MVPQFFFLWSFTHTQWVAETNKKKKTHEKYHSFIKSSQKNPFGKYFFQCRKRENNFSSKVLALKYRFSLNFWPSKKSHKKRFAVEKIARFFGLTDWLQRINFFFTEIEPIYSVIPINPLFEEFIQHACLQPDFNFFFFHRLLPNWIYFE